MILIDGKKEAGSLRLKLKEEVNELKKKFNDVPGLTVILSWLVAFNIINTGNRFVYSVLDFTYRMTEPFLNRIRTFLPNLGAFDISPVILLLLIWIMQMCMEYYIRPII